MDNKFILKSIIFVILILENANIAAMGSTRTTTRKHFR